MALNVLTSVLSEQVEYVVTKRQQNWDYLKRTHQGKVHWLNVVKLSKKNILEFFPPEKLQKRVRRWFILGLSLGRLLELNDGATLVRALCQLLEEYEHHISHEKEKSERPRSNTAHFLYSGSANGSSHVQAVVAVAAAAAAAAEQHNEPIKPQLHKVGKNVVYEYLQMPFATVDGLDYCEVVHSLCDVLSLVYSKFLDDSCTPAHIHEAILKVDRKLKQLVIAKITQDLTTIATPLLKIELKKLLNNMFIDDSKSTAITKKFFTLQEDDGKKEGGAGNDWGLDDLDEGLE